MYVWKSRKLKHSLYVNIAFASLQQVDEEQTFEANCASISEKV